MAESNPRRAVVLVIDACGIGALPDAGDYGDQGTNTLAHLAEQVGGLTLPAMAGLGLGCIEPLKGIAPSPDPAIHGRLAPLGPGKDSITGHWELMGVSLRAPLPTYPDGFPDQLVASLEGALGRGLICNRPDNGLKAIEDFGPEHLRAGALILYTSQDSVLQLAAHTDLVPEAELYEACIRAREVMSGKDAVGRVIARPFSGTEGDFSRTTGRRDFALQPPSRSYLEELQESGSEVAGVGKIDDLFAGRGLTQRRPGATNERALAEVRALMAELQEGLIFANLIETDQVYGHRKDMVGFAEALSRIDRQLEEMLAVLRPEDLLVVTADHGVDMAHPGTDHTREHVPLLAVSGAMQERARAGHSRGGFRHDGQMADVGATVLQWLSGRGAPQLPGRSFLS